MSETEVVEVDAPDAEVADAPDPAIADQARKYGWKPEGEWKGDPPPHGFVGADEYLEIPKVQARILREERDELKAERARLKAEHDDRIARLDRMNDENEKRRAERHAAAIARIKAEQRRAAEVGDTEAYDRLEAERDGLKPAGAPADAAEPVRPGAEEVEAVERWRQAAERQADHWFNVNPIMKQAAVALYGEATQHGISGGPARLAYMEKRMREEFPHKFEAPKQRAARVDGGGLGAPGRGIADKLPTAARERAKKDVKAGLYESVEAWAKFYFSEFDE